MWWASLWLAFPLFSPIKKILSLSPPEPFAEGFYPILLDRLFNDSFNSTMLSTACRHLSGRMARASLFQMTTRGMVAPKLGERDASYAWNKSCYSGIDYTINDEATVYEAVEKFAAYGVGKNVL